MLCKVQMTQMRKSTIERMRAVLPATSWQASSNLGVQNQQACRVLSYMVKAGYAEVNGRDLPPTCTLVDVYHPTTKQIL
jgi:hypothetical protein